MCRQVETLDGRTAVMFGRGEFRLLVNSVPAHVCPNCGEAYLEEETAEQLLRIARETSEAGILDVQCEYSAFQI
jgi:YgiT-type zinc finger domain-containing protein